MKTILHVSKFNLMVSNQSNPNFLKSVWKFSHARGFVAYGTRTARFFKTKKEAINSPEALYY